MRTSSETTSRGASSLTVVRAGSVAASLAIEKWRAASAAICGRWGMQRIWRPSAQGRRRRRGRAQSPARALDPLGRGGRLALGRGQRVLGPGELGATRRAGLGVGEEGGDRAAVLALEPLERRQPLLDRVEPAGLGL